jgi:hypothetical protein
LLLLAVFVALLSVSACTVTTQTTTAYIELLGSIFRRLHKIAESRY